MEELNEALTAQQRRKRSRTMKRHGRKIAAARKRKAKRKATPEKLQSRARKKAINKVRDMVAGRKGGSYSDLSPSEKSMIDKKVEKRKSAIDRLTKKMLPKVRKIEKARMSGKSTRIDESFEELFEASSSDTKPKKRFHELMTKDGKVKHDKRFRMYKKNINEEFENLMEAKEEIWAFDIGLSAPGWKGQESELIGPIKKKTKKYVDRGKEESVIYIKGSRALAMIIAREIDNFLGTGSLVQQEVKNGDALAKNYWEKTYNGKYKKDNDYARDALNFNESVNMDKKHSRQDDRLDDRQAREKKRKKLRDLRDKINDVRSEEVIIENDEDILDMVDDIMESLQNDELKTQNKIEEIAEESGFLPEVISEVHDLCLENWTEESGQDANQYAINGVYSFVNEGKAREDYSHVLEENAIIDKAVKAMNRMVGSGMSVQDASWDVSKASGVNTRPKELMKAYFKVYGENDRTNLRQGSAVSNRLKKKYGFNEEAKSKAQQRAAGMAYAAKKGDIPKSKLKGAAKEMSKMSDEDLKDYAETKHKGKPEKVEEGFKDIMKKIQGVDDESISKTISKMSDYELKTAVNSVDPKSAKRVLGPKDYAFWKAAKAKLNEEHGAGEWGTDKLRKKYIKDTPGQKDPKK